MEIQTNVTPNVKSALKHELKRPTKMTPTELAIVICVATTGFLLQISTVWFYHKAPDVPAVVPTSQEARTTNGASITTMSLV